MKNAPVPERSRRGKLGNYKKVRAYFEEHSLE